MNTDIRLSLSFWDNPKTVKLERRLGLEGVKSLQILWMWVAENRPSGDLRGHDEGLAAINDSLTTVERPLTNRTTNVERKLNEEDIEIAARWSGEENRFVDTLVDLGWLDKTDTGYVIHGWAEHNQWASCATSRGDRARFSRLAKVKPELYKKMKEQGVVSITSSEYNSVINDSLTTVERPLTNRTTPAPAPAPSPSPYEELPSTARGGGGDPFLMTTDWEPSKYFAILAETSGLVPPPPEEAETALREFRTYWLTQKRQRTAHEWDLAFIKAIKSGFSSPRGKPGGQGSGAVRPRSVRDALIIQGEEIARALNDDERRKQQIGPHGRQEGGVLLEHQVQIGGIRQ